MATSKAQDRSEQVRLLAGRASRLADRLGDDVLDLDTKDAEVARLLGDSATGIDVAMSEALRTSTTQLSRAATLLRTFADDAASYGVRP